MDNDACARRAEGNAGKGIRERERKRRERMVDEKEMTRRGTGRDQDEYLISDNQEVNNL